MGHEISPAVERIQVAVRAAVQETTRLADWLLGLLEDDEGKPTVLLRSLGVEPDTIRRVVANRADWVDCAAPPDSYLFERAREKAIELRGDPTLTTEFVLLAVLLADERFARGIAECGLPAMELEKLLDSGRRERIAEDESGPTFTIVEPIEQADTARILDVNLNRARESLRILDDYCRFVLNDRRLTEDVKTLRHDLAEVASTLSVREMIRSRNTVGDVGIEVAAPGEYERISPAQVAAVNWKRLQEALRSIEEFGKIIGPEFGRKIEQIRYRTYSLEKAVLSDSRKKLENARLYVLLTGSQCQAAMDWTIAESAAGGAELFQLREKSLTDRELLERARNVRTWTRKAGAMFIMNDRPDIARLAEADGVHLGQDDLSISAARRILGPDSIIGVSTHTPEQLRQAVRDGADYLGIGPVFPSKTKAFDHFAGLDFVRFAAEETSLPAFALGGITPANVGEVTAVGANRIAVASSVTEADEPRLAAGVLRQAMG